MRLTYKQLTMWCYSYELLIFYLFYIEAKILAGRYCTWIYGKETATEMAMISVYLWFLSGSSCIFMKLLHVLFVCWLCLTSLFIFVYLPVYPNQKWRIIWQKCHWTGNQCFSMLLQFSLPIYIVSHFLNVNRKKGLKEYCNRAMRQRKSQ